MDQENQPPPNEFHYVTFRKKAGHNEDFSYMDNSHETIKSVTPKRPFISYDYVLSNTSPSSSNCSHQTAVIPHESQGSSSFTTEEKQVPLTCAFVISPPTKHVYSSILDDDNGYVPAYINQKFKHPLPYSIHNASNQRTMKIIQKPNSTTQMKTSTSSHSIASIAAANEYQGSSFQPSLRMRVPVNSSSTNTIEKQEYAFTILLNSLFTPDEFVNVQQSTFQAQTKEQMPYKALAETNRWYSLRDRARNLYETEIKPVATKISCDIDQSRINPKSDLNFAARTVNRQALLNFISSYNRTWFRLAMEILFPIDIDSNQPMKTYIDQYLIQTTTLSITKAVSPLIRLTLKNLIIIVVFLERAKLKHLIEYDPCLYVKESKFKSTKDTLDVISRDFISTDTNLLRRLKLAGFEPQYKQTSLDEYNYSISEKQLFDDLKDGIRLSRCAYVLLSSNTNPFSFTDLSSRLKCPVVNLVHKLLNIDQAFDLFQKYGHVNLSGITNKDIMSGNKLRTLELLWRIFVVCYVPKFIQSHDVLINEIEQLKQNLTEHVLVRPIEKEISIETNLQLFSQKQTTPIISDIMKWAQLVCAHYRFWIKDLQESFSDGRALLFIIAYYLPNLINYQNDIKHYTTIGICQTKRDHIQFNDELRSTSGSTERLKRDAIKNVKSNFKLLEERTKQLPMFLSDLVKYEQYIATDIPDERVTIIILTLLARDLLFSNAQDINRNQQIFEQIKQQIQFDNDSDQLDDTDQQYQSSRQDFYFIFD
ncbi:unnamed protein product [Didymodactylos carnosus]|uniref:Calponin-homology (CH) domain-containing protein n=1 Tax=Didymodactylos carnosus TaxID=1234261 RepID=A0A813UD26_9BILA|nr:unnamed protein product [Didymodactylos carnosus]CAF0825041.1 unnamed protein product [Didymodactylos carnosus]CAF3521206.1 unnamed protein product [Didymodactylos carnosus]CAF3611742.1 unnamed protein product [Didymodactylos carnosus]